MKNIILLLASFLPLILSSQGFEVSPVLVSFNAEPGTSQTKTLTINNYFNQRRAFNLVLGDFNRNEKGEKIYFESGKLGNRSCADWITITPSYVEVNPNESVDITVTMKVPSGQNNTRWAILYVRAAKEQSSFNADKSFASGVVISPTIGVQIYQSPSSNTKYSAKLSKLKEITTSADKERKLSVMVENTGDKNIDCKLYLLIADLNKGTEVKTSPIKLPLLPSSGQEAILKVPSNLAKGKYSVAAILDYGHGTDLEGIQIEMEIK